MSAISELCSAPADAFAKRQIPESAYIFQIIDAEIMHGYWKPNPEKGRGAVWFEAYVPTIQIVDVILPGDPQLDEEIKTGLELFGEWRGFKPPMGSGRWTMQLEIPGYDDKILCAGVSNLNFSLCETTPGWEALKEIRNSDKRFWTSANARGEEDGFLVKVLSTDPKVFTPVKLTKKMNLADRVKASVNTFFVANITYQQDAEGKFEPRMGLENLSQV